MGAKAKKPHWTQTPEGQRRQSRRMKRQWRQAKQQGDTTLKQRDHHHHYPKPGATRANATPSQELDLHVAYAFGRAQGLIHSYAEALGLPGEQLAYRVGQLLQDPAGGRVRGPGHPVPGV